jgi:F-type H+-transporting ATPase subunit delta
MPRQSAARRYAEAAFQVAVRDDTIETWRRELDTAAAVVEDERVGRTLANPSIPLESRDTMARKAFASIAGDKVMNLIALTLRRGRIEELPRIAAEFRRLDDQRQGITHAVATSADALTPQEARALTERLERLTGGKVALDLRVDPDLLGGLVVRIGDRLIDGSVRSRLERLRNQLVSGAL